LLLAAILSAGPGLPATAIPAEGPAILTFHGDPGRTGWTRDEHTLTPAALRTGPFGLLWASQVDGEIDAEPLVVSGVAVLGRVRTVVYVVTERDFIYAFDAADGGLLWGPVSLGTPVPRTSRSCGHDAPVGIASTPVLDGGAGTLYVVGLTASPGERAPAYLIAAVDIKSGMARPGWPVPVAPAPSSGFTVDGRVGQQRGALLLMSGVVYVPLGGNRDGCGAASGGVVAVRVTAPQGPQQAFAAPGGPSRGIWTAGGIAADSRSDLYAVIRGGDAAGPRDALIRLTTSPTLQVSGTPRDFFTPGGAGGLNGTGDGPGSSTPLVVPDRPDLASPRLVFFEDGRGVAHVVNRDDMGGVSRGNGSVGEEGSSRCVFGACDRDVPQAPPAAAYWDGGSVGRVVLVAGLGRQPAPCQGTGGVVALRLATPVAHSPKLDVAWCSASMPDPGAPSVSGEAPDGGVAWVLDSGDDPTLYALDARTGAMLYRSGGADAVGRAQPSVTPAVVGGRVYVGAGDRVEAFGLR